DDAYVRATSNALLLLKKGTRGRDYAGVKTDPPEEGIVSLVGRVAGVHLPLGGRFLEPAEALVSEGDPVEYGQKIGEPVDEGLSVGVWSSMDGTVSSIEDGIVAINGGAVPQEEAEAETEAEVARLVEPQEEAEAEATR
ncbi:MAG: hypothetical protein M3426_04650, partial [Actinomycetota bacterium]|nr:hypothetical protein [Actinomycetota bacterium]